MGSQDRREHDRVPVRFPVRVRAQDGQEFDGLVENLGALGALVSTTDLEAPCDIGDRLLLAISRGAPGAVLSVYGTVVRLEQEFSGGEVHRAFAVRFDASVE